LSLRIVSFFWHLVEHLNQSPWNPTYSWTYCSGSEILSQALFIPTVLLLPDLLLIRRAYFHSVLDRLIVSVMDRVAVQREVRHVPYYTRVYCTVVWSRGTTVSHLCLRRLVWMREYRQRYVGGVILSSQENDYTRSCTVAIRNPFKEYIRSASFNLGFSWGTVVINSCM